jgi:hypothetical protein
MEPLQPTPTRPLIPGRAITPISRQETPIDVDGLSWPSMFISIAKKHYFNL